MNNSMVMSMLGQILGQDNLRQYQQKWSSMTPQQQQQEMSKVTSMTPQQRNNILQQHGINPNMFSGVQQENKRGNNNQGWSY